MNPASYSLYFNQFAAILEKKHIWQQNLITANIDRDVMLIRSEAFTKNKVTATTATSVRNTTS